MGRKRVEIKAECAERLKIILDEQGINQLQLSEMIHISQQTISKIMNENASLTENSARMIINLFPKYRLEWLMGYDQYKTLSDLYIGIISEAQHEGDMLMLGLQAFACLNGYVIDCSLESDNSNAEDLVRKLKKAYSVSHNEKKAFLSVNEMNALQNEICEFVLFKLEQLMRRAENG